MQNSRERVCKPVLHWSGLHVYIFVVSQSRDQERHYVQNMKLGHLATLQLTQGRRKGRYALWDGAKNKRFEFRT